MFGFLAALFLMLAVLPSASRRAPLSSSETRFVEKSEHGLNIMPASCASSPAYYHADLAATADSKGFVSSSVAGEYGAGTTFGAPLCTCGADGCTPVGCVQSTYVCVTNTTGNTYFIPAKTAAELQAFKNLGSSIPGLIVK